MCVGRARQSQGQMESAFECSAGSSSQHYVRVRDSWRLDE